MRDEAGFRAFVEANGASLLHAARLLTGDHHRGEDLVQATLTKLYPRWGRVDAPLAYARTTMMREHVDQRRRRWWGERPVETMPDAGVVDPTPDDRDDLRRRLADLQPAERAVVVLRYYCDLSEADTAHTLGMPLGTVKSTGARALGKLRVDVLS